MSSQFKDGIICTDEDIQRSLAPETKDSIHCLTRGQSIGLTIVAETGLFSLFAVLIVFWIIIRNIVRRIRHTTNNRWHLFQEPMDILMLSLFGADLIQAVGAVMDLKWIRDGKVEIGGFCTAQGVIQQLGETGVAITTLMIAIYTFIGIWWGRGAGAVFVTGVVITLTWIFVVLIVVIGNAIHSDKLELYQAPTPYWCWIGQNYLEFRIWGEYFWFWLTLGMSLFTYILLFFWSRGNIVRHEDSWWKFSIQRSHPSTNVMRGRQSLMMLAYPVIYCILILPLSVVRWIGFFQERGGRESHIASSATLTVIAIYGLSGVCNVVLLLTTRPNSVLFGRPIDYGTGRPPSVRVHTAEGSEATFPLKERHNDHGASLGRLPSR